MNTKAGIEKTGSKSLSRSTIHIVGPHLFCNEILGNMIESETEARCFCEKSFEDIQKTSRDRSGPELFLWDCLGKNLEEFMTEFESSVEKIAGSEFVALLNVCPGLGIEESCVNQGVRGIFYENDKISHFLKGVRAIFEGELWFSRDVMTKFILNDRDDEKTSMKVRKILTQREIEILSLVAVGCKNEEIANKLCLSPHTIKTHLYNLYKKINVNNRLQATLWAAKKL